MHNVFKLYIKKNPSKYLHYVALSKVAQRENHELEIWSVELVLSSETSARSLIKDKRDPEQVKTSSELRSQWATISITRWVLSIHILN